MCKVPGYTLEERFKDKSGTDLAHRIQTKLPSKDVAEMGLEGKGCQKTVGADLGG